MSFSKPVPMKMLLLAMLLTSLHPVYSLKNYDVHTSKRRQHRTRSSITFDNTNFNQFVCPHGKDSTSSHDMSACANSSIEVPTLFQNCEKILSATITHISIQICIQFEILLLPKSSVLAVSDRTQPLPSQRDIRNFRYFFNGSLLIFDTLFPFNGAIHGYEFKGKALIHRNLLFFECDSIILFEDRACSKCKAFCTKSDQGVKKFRTESVLKPFSTQDLFRRGIDDNSMQERLHQAKKRNKRKIVKTPRRLTCSLHLVSDYLFFKYVGDENTTKTRHIMLELVNKVNTIFENSFNAQMGLDEVGFVVRNVTIFQSEWSGDHKLRDGYVTPAEYLETFSLYDFSTVCLAVGLTFRDFGGVIGTAFPWSPSVSKPGGICEERLKINSHHVSYNTVIMSFLSPTTELSEQALALILTHELGHSFGASHDVTIECLPGEEIGNYIMSSKANPGVKPNNFLFSPCSMRSMLLVIMKKENCLHPTDIISTDSQDAEHMLKTSLG